MRQIYCIRATLLQLRELRTNKYSGMRVPPRRGFAHEPSRVLRELQLGYCTPQTCRYIVGPRCYSQTPTIFGIRRHDFN